MDYAHIFALQEELLTHSLFVGDWGGGGCSPQRVKRLGSKVRRINPGSRTMSGADEGASPGGSAMWMMPPMGEWGGVSPGSRGAHAAMGGREGGGGWQRPQARTAATVSRGEGEGAGTGQRTVGSRMIEANGPDSRMAGGRTS